MKNLNWLESQESEFNINFILKYKELIGQLLEKAGDRFSNYGCNEFDLTDALPELGDQHELAKTIFDEDDSDRYDSEADYSTMQDYELMLFFADKIRNLK